MNRISPTTWIIYLIYVGAGGRRGGRGGGEEFRRRGGGGDGAGRETDVSADHMHGCREQRGGV